MDETIGSDTRMKICNLMPIDITYAPEGDMSRAIVIPKSGFIAKLSQGEQTIDTIETEFGILPIFQQPKWGELYVVAVNEVGQEASNHLSFDEYCAPNKGWVYLVNAVVAQELAGRHDVITPATGRLGVIREDGKIIAVTHFNQFC